MGNKLRNIAGLGSLLALSLLASGCGGNIASDRFETEVQGRNDIRQKLQIDKNDGRIKNWAEDPFTEMSSVRIYPDFSVERNDGDISYVEYTSPADDENVARNEIQVLFNNGKDYFYMPSSWGVASEINNYARNGYSGQIQRHLLEST